MLLITPLSCIPRTVSYVIEPQRYGSLENARETFRCEVQRRVEMMVGSYIPNYVHLR